MTIMRKNKPWPRTRPIPVALDFDTACLFAYLPNRLLAVLPLVLLAALATPAARAQESEPESAPVTESVQGASTARIAAPQTDATFTFTSDVHVSFDGYDDHQGIEDLIYNQGASGVNMLLLPNETKPSTVSFPWAHSDACVGTGFDFMKDLCNDIQLVRKLNHLPTNVWHSDGFTDANGHPAKLAGAGKTVGTPLGLIIAGDLTDCGGGSDNVKVHQGSWWHEEDCDIDYRNGIPGKELQIFQQLFEPRIAGLNFYEPLANYPVIQGLKNPDEDVPLKYWIYPGLGNHDLGFDKSGDMMTYVRQWNRNQPASDYHHVLNSEDHSGSYSWNWGKLHIVNMGVFAGSNNRSGATSDSNYPYDQEVMNWLKNDLTYYASAGQPVILVQHFGFDPYSLTTNWYLGGDNNAKQAEQDLWPVLAPYNVIGIFHGHHHKQAFYTFQPEETYVDGVAYYKSHMAYDVFEPGPGFGQDFAAIHVTDTFMDVQATKWDDDFDNTQSTVNFGLFFNKRLVKTPTSGASSFLESGDSIATSVTYDGARYLIGANPNRKFVIRKMMDAANLPLVTTGTFAVEPKFLVSYSVGKFAYVLVSDGITIASYRMTPLLTLQQQWIEVMPLNGLAPLMSANGKPYLLVDQANSGRVSFQYFQLSNTGLIAAGNSLELGGAYTEHAQMISFPTADQGFTVIRYTPGGGVEIYHGWVDIYGDTVLELKSQEFWVADSTYAFAPAYKPNVFIQLVTLADNSIAILVKSPSCQHYNGSNQCDTIDSVDSPYSVRTLTQDGFGTQVAWRGQVQGIFPFGAVSFVPLGLINGVPAVGVYSSWGVYSTISVQD